MKAKIDSEFEKLSLPISDEKKDKLTADLIRNGCREPLKTWNGLIVDGYKRYRICREHKIPFQCKEVQELQGQTRLGAMFWILANQFQRKLPSFVRGEVFLKLIHVIDNQLSLLNDADTARRNNLMNTKQKVQKTVGLSEDTIRKIEFIQKCGTLAQIERARLGGCENSIDEIYAEIAKEKSPKSDKPKNAETSQKPLSFNYNDVKKEIRMISTVNLSIDHTYQRPLNMAIVKKIVATYNPCIVNDIKVSSRDDKFYIFDGQHTAAALKILNGNKDLTVRCKVHYGLSQQQEAELFHLQCGITTSIRSINDLKACLIAKDPQMMAFLTVTKKHGFSIDFDKYDSGENRISAPKRAYSIYKKNPEIYEEMLYLLRKTWNGNAESLSGLFLAGMYEFLKANKDGYDAEIFIKRLSVVNPHDIFIAGKRVGGGGNARFANQMIYAYNKRLGGKRRLPEIQLYGN